MRYFGGKFRIRDKIVSIINSIDTEFYIEPFCGAAWVGEIVDKPYRILSDRNSYLIAMWKALQGGWIPPDAITEDEYYQIKSNGSPNYLKGFCGFASSYGGKFWGGYARGTQSNGQPRNYTLNAKRQCIKRVNGGLASCVFKCSGYGDILSKTLKMQNTACIYLDPPYENTTKFYGLPDFDYNTFWHNVEIVSTKHYVITSSYEAPPKFKCIAEIPAKLDMTTEPRIEKLFAMGLLLEDYDL